MLHDGHGDRAINGEGDRSAYGLFETGARFLPGTMRCGFPGRLEVNVPHVLRQWEKSDNEEIVTYQDDLSSAKERLLQAEKVLENYLQCPISDIELLKQLIRAEASARTEYIDQNARLGPVR